jgi:hypothetical protein
VELYLADADNCTILFRNPKTGQIEIPRFALPKKGISIVA